ncbi:hypothetical protein AB6J97_005179 [Raoultella ornithinolytica]|nr:hypothetical protein [Raoultella ornithinolytica]HAT3652082.1 hypothetical protein [Raoultella ornithinolytica]
MTKNEWILRLRRCTSGETLEKVIEKNKYSLSDSELEHFNAAVDGVVCGRGRNPTLRLWPAIFSGEIDVFPSERRNMGQEIGR